MTAQIRTLEHVKNSLDPEALKIFQNQWSTYRKLLEFNYLSHHEVLSALGSAIAEIKGPISFLDLACGDAYGIREALSGVSMERYVGVDMSISALRLAAQEFHDATFRVDLVQGDMFEGLNEQKDPFDFVWCGLCLHHLRTEDKLEALKAMRRITRKSCMIYEPTLVGDETQAEFMTRFLRDNIQAWNKLTPQQWADISAHVTQCDLPESEENWRNMGLMSGFREARSIFHSPTNFAVLYRFDV